MHLVITEKQLTDIVKRRFPDQEISEQGEDAAAAAPEAGTSSDGETKTGMPKWESGVTRGPANQIAVTRWKDIAGVTPARGKANPLWEQNLLVPPNSIDPETLNKALNPATDTPYVEKTTFWGDKWKIPTDGSVQVGYWDSKKSRASRFKNAQESEGYWYWKQDFYDPKTKETTSKNFLAPDEATLEGFFPDNTIRGIYVVKEDKYYAVIMHKTGDFWKPYNGYYYSPGNNQKAIPYKPENYIHTSLTTSTVSWVKDNWPLIAEVILSTVVGIATGGSSLMAQALWQAGISAGFAIGVYAFSKKTDEDKRGLATGLIIATLPFIPAIVNKFNLKGPLKGLAKYGDELANATTEDEIATIIAKFPEAEQTIIKTAFKEVPKYEFEKIIANNAARGFAKLVRTGKIDLGKLPAHKLKFWQELLIEGGPVIPIDIAIGYVYPTIQERKKAENSIKVASGNLESDENISRVDSVIAAKKQKLNTITQDSVNKPQTINKNTTSNTKPVPYDDFQRGPRVKIDTTTIK